MGHGVTAPFNMTIGGHLPWELLRNGVLVEGAQVMIADQRLGCDPVGQTILVMFSIGNTHNHIHEYILYVIYIYVLFVYIYVHYML